MSRETDNRAFVKYLQNRLGLVEDEWAGKLLRAAIEPLLPKPQVSQGYSERFLKMMPWIFQWEGKVFENDPQDPGGATKYGIDQRSHPNLNIRNLTEDQAVDIYWNEYWQRNKCGDLAFPLGECFYNACVNTGGSQAKKFLERSEGSWTSFIAKHKDFYRSLATSKPSMGKFLAGWLNRTNDLTRWIKENE